MFGHASDPSRIWAFGAKPPSENLELVSDQIRLARVYRNALADLEIERRRRADEALRVHYPGLDVLESRAEALAARLEELRGHIRVAKGRSRSNKAVPAELREEAAAVRGELDEARREFRETRKRAFADATLRDDLDEVEAWAVARGKVLRDESGLYWGNYLAVEQACQSFRKGPPPAFRRWDGSGKVAVQLQGGLPWADALAGRDTRFRVEVLPAGSLAGRNDRRPAADPDSRRSRRTRRVALAWLRVGSEGRAPVWAKVPFVLHRDPPEGAVVKWVYLHRSRVGTHERWELQVVLARKEGWACREPAGGAAAGRVGIDLGWRLLPGGGLRVACWRGSDGGGGEVVLDAAAVSRWDRAETLRSQRDLNFDRARQRLGAWLAGREAVPAWLAEATEHLAQWRSPARLARVVLEWRGRRFGGDDLEYSVLEAWRAQDRHLLDWESFQRAGAANFRDALYREFAAGLAGRYGQFRLEDTDWSGLGVLPPDESAEGVAARARYLQRVASVGRLAQVVREAFGVSQGERRRQRALPAGERLESAGRGVFAPAEFTTRDCHLCGTRNEWDQARELEHTCSGCGETWDQDVNAAMNLLAFPGGAGGVGGVPSRGRSPRPASGGAVAATPGAARGA